MRMGPEATGLTTCIYDWQDVILSLNICVYIYILLSHRALHTSHVKPPFSHSRNVRILITPAPENCHAVARSA